MEINMKKITYTLVVVLVFAIALSFLSLIPTSVYALSITDEGRCFDKGSALKMPVNFDAIPKSYEAWIKLDTSLKGRGGVIMGTYKESSSPSFNIEIKENGNPRVYYNDGSVVTDKTFTCVDVRTDEWVHLAITHEKNKLNCYINGELSETIQDVSFPDFAPERAMMIGGDYRTGNDQYNMQYFKGSIKEIAVFNDVRTPDEVAADYVALDFDDDNLLASYTLSPNCVESKDLSKNGYDIVSPWVDESDIDIPNDYAYSFMIVGDTQIITDQHSEYLHCIYDYIVDNVEDKKVKYVFGLGDITDNDTEEEWNTAKNEIAKLDGVVRYSIIRGNHDIYSAGKKLDRQSKFDEIYGSPDAPYARQYTYFYDGGAQDNFRARNTIHFFEAGGIHYMNVALDYGANDDILEWASSIISANPNYNVIISTHCYLNASGDYYTSKNASHPERDYGKNANNGDELWEKFVSKHPNIVMVLCGHASSSKIVVREVEGDTGNKVQEILIDPQGLDISPTVSPTGLVATFYFDENGRNITTTYYSTIKGKYYKAENNFEFSINRIEEPNEKFEISFESSGAEGTMNSFTYLGGKFYLPTCHFTPPFAHEFIGWAMSSDGEVITDSFITPTSDMTLYAKWGLRDYTIHFNSAQGTPIDSITAKYNTPLTVPPDPTRLGYIFGGWDSELPTSMPASDITVNAIWIPDNDTPYRIDHYFENVDGDGYTVNENMTEQLTGTTGTTVYAVPKNVPHFTHLVKERYSKSLLKADGSTVLRVYYDREEYTVTFASGGGKLVEGNENVLLKYGVTIEPPTYIREGYTFAGWDYDISKTACENVTITAKWTLSGSSVGLIIGISAGAVTLIAGCVALVIFIKRRKSI